MTGVSNSPSRSTPSRNDELCYLKPAGIFHLNSVCNKSVGVWGDNWKGRTATSRKMHIGDHFIFIGNIINESDPRTMGEGGFLLAFTCLRRTCMMSITFLYISLNTESCAKHMDTEQGSKET